MISQKLKLNMWNPFRRKGEEKFGAPDEPFSSYDTAAFEERREKFLPAENSRVIWVKSVVRGCLLALILLMPIFFLPFTAPSDVLQIGKYVLISAVAFVGLVGWLVVIIRQGGIVFKRSGLGAGVLAILMAWFFSSVFSIEARSSFVTSGGFITWAALSVIFLLIINFFEKSDLEKISNYFIAGVFLALLTGLLNLYGVPVFGWLKAFTYEKLSVGNQFNTVGSVNSLGGVAAISFVFVMARYFLGAMSSKPGINGELENPASRDSKLAQWSWRIAKVGTVLLSTIIILTLNWWVLYVVLAVGMLAIALAPGIVGKLLGNNFDLKVINLIGPMILLVLSLLLVFGGKYVDVNLPGKSGISPEISLSQQTSYTVFKGVMDKMPLFGTGPGNYRIAYDLFRPSEINSTSLWNAKFNNGASELFNIATTGGLLTLVGLLALIYFVVINSSIIAKKYSDTSGSISLWTVMPGFLSLLVFGGFYGFSMVVWFAFWLFVSMIGVSTTQAEKNIGIAINSSSLSSVLTSLAMVSILPLSAIGGFFVATRYLAEVSYAKVLRIDSTSEASLDRMIDLLKQANKNSPGDVKYMDGLARSYVSKINLSSKNQKNADDTKKLRELTVAAVDLANSMTKKYGNDPYSWQSAAGIYTGLNQVLNGADDAAIQSYEEYTKLAANDPVGFMNLANVRSSRAERNNAALIDAKNKKLGIKNEKEVTDMIINDYRNAETAYKKVIKLKPDMAQAYYSLGVVYERENKLPDAIKQLELLLANQPNNPSLAFELGLLYYRSNQKDKALSAMALAVALFKDYSNARWYLALMLEEQGKIDLAIGQLKEILKLDVNKDNKIVSDKLASLEAGKREIPPGKVTGRQPLP